MLILPWLAAATTFILLFMPALIASELAHVTFRRPKLFAPVFFGVCSWFFVTTSGDLHPLEALDLLLIWNWVGLAVVVLYSAVDMFRNVRYGLYGVACGVVAMMFVGTLIWHVEGKIARYPRSKEVTIETATL